MSTSSQSAESRSRRKPATIYDIAERAGVNPSTVSRALNQPGRINIKTMERIQAAASELQYQVNPFARALPTGKTMMLGFIVADITNPVLFEIIRAAEKTALQFGYTLIVAESQESGDRETQTVQRVIPFFDGLVLATTRLSDEQIRELAAQKPMVAINRQVEDVECIVPDIEREIYQAVKHLASLGHQKIAYLSGPPRSWINGVRSEEIHKAAKALGMAVTVVGPIEPTLAGGGAALDQVLSAGVTAVLTYNDLMAIGLLRQASVQHIRVPEQLSVVGFDNIFVSEFTTPPLTTIRTPLSEAGEQAVQTLLTMFDESAGEASRPVLATELVLRESTSKPQS